VEGVGGGPVEAVTVRALSADERRVLQLVARGRRESVSGTASDAEVVLRLAERRCVRILPWDATHKTAVLTELGEIALRLP